MHIPHLWPRSPLVKKLLLLSAVVLVAYANGGLAQSPPNLEIELGENSQVRLSWNETSDDVVLEESFTLRNWQPFPETPALENGRFSAFADVVEGGHFFRLYLFQEGALPRDPATIAPSVPLGVANPMLEATSFLYTGTNPIQTGVTAETMDSKRIVVLRGIVSTGDGNPLPGVIISILNHPEFGQTLSREDGRFDMAVNGGGMVTVNYVATGYLPVQRLVNTPWRDYVPVPDVIMIPVDAQVTTVTADSTEMQVARGSMMSDEDGSRQATLLFPSGTTATMLMPDGSEQPLTSLSVRATEYTVGPNGPKAMPAALPPTSGYTYAVELSADEAMAAGATCLTFSQPLYNYVENFLEFPVGSIVPNGYYDREKAAWMPSENGRVIKITANNDGTTEVDSVGAGALPPLTLSEDELKQLASLYPVGQELWRVPIAHFTPWDHNWPYGPPEDAVAPDEPPNVEEALDDPCIQTGSSLIEVENQILGETIEIPGTGFALNYRSNRVPGRKAAYVLDIPLSGPQLPESLRRIQLEITFAGKRVEMSFGPVPNQRHTEEWDGKDAYDREMQGPVIATVRVGYVYQAIYYEPATFAQSFGAFSGTSISGSRARQEITLWKESHVTLGTLPSPVGGWSLSPHHSYDPAGRVLYFGNGNRISAEAIGNVISTVAGTGIQSANSIQNKPAKTIGLNSPTNVTVAPDGSYLIADMQSHVIRRVGTDGIMTIVAGKSGWSGNFSGDGGPATQAELRFPHSVALGADGSLYIADRDNHRIRRIGPDGIINTVAGNGTTGSFGDNGPATLAQLNTPYDVAVGADGSIYIADTHNHRIRRVGPDGIITTVAGNGVAGFSGDGGPASQARLWVPRGLSVAADGSLYIADFENHRIRLVGPDGVIRTIAGTGTAGFSGDGGLATEAELYLPRDVTVGPNGSVYFSDFNNNRIRIIDPNGIIATIAGNGAGGGNGAYSGDGGPARSARLGRPQGLAIAPDGGILFADWDYHLIWRIASSMPGFPAENFLIASQDGAQLHEFDASGRHLRTRDAFTNSVMFEFSYDSAGRLVSVNDAYGKVTAIQRNLTGHPTSIIGPFGQTTVLAVNSDGYLNQITSPTGETIQLAYTADGLLTSLTNPRGHTSSYGYDSLGRLTSATDPTGAVKTISRTGTSRDLTVTVTTSLGGVNSYQVERLSTGDVRRTTTDTAGNQILVLKGRDGKLAATFPDGTTASVVLGPDPRWGMQAPIATSLVLNSPGGKVYTTTSQRTATLTNQSDILSLGTLTDTLTINGRKITWAYNAADRTWTTTSPSGRRKTTVVDLLGRPVQSQFGGLAESSFTYDPQGRISSIILGSAEDSREEILFYGEDGFLQSVTNPEDHTLAFSRDTSGRITTLTFPDGGKSHYAYDSYGNTTGITPPGQPDHLRTYNQNNQVLTNEVPVVGEQNNQTIYYYDQDRKPLQIDRPDGQSLAIQYDSAGRQKLVTNSEGDTVYDYDANGRLIALTRDQGPTLLFAYDGGLPTGVTWTGPVEGSVTFDYDNNFQMNSLSVNDSNPVTLTYDLDGLPVQAADLTLTRNAMNGLVTGTSLGVISDSITYDAFGALASYTASQNGNVVFAATYTRDVMGRISFKDETIEGVFDNFSYTYDLAGRLTEFGQADFRVAGYSYDSNGNRLSVTNLNGTTNASYDAQDRLVQFGATTYFHNANGERISQSNASETTQYQYDTFGNLIGVTLPDTTKIDYVLDGAMRRIGKKINGSLAQGFLYQDNLKPIAELDGNNSVVSRFVYSTGVNVPAYLIKGGVSYRIITDYLGSPRLVIDSATGAIVQRLDYDAFGKVIQDTNPGFQPFGFAGGLYDLHTGLVHFGAREYDPNTGRWTSKDPIGFQGGESNLYGYVLNDPINKTDPSGLLFGDLLDALLEPIPFPFGPQRGASPCGPDSSYTQAEERVRDAFNELIDDQVDNAVQNLTGGAKFLGPIGFASDAATASASYLVNLHGLFREEHEYLDDILSGSTSIKDYAVRKYFHPNPWEGPRPCPGGPCGQ